MLPAQVADHFNLLSCITSTIVFSVPVVLLTSIFLILLSLDTPSIDLRHCISNTKGFFSSAAVKAQVYDA